MCPVRHKCYYCFITLTNDFPLHPAGVGKSEREIVYNYVNEARTGDSIFPEKSDLFNLVKNKKSIQFNRAEQTHHNQLHCINNIQTLSELHWKIISSFADTSPVLVLHIWIVTVYLSIRDEYKYRPRKQSCRWSGYILIIHIALALLMDYVVNAPQFNWNMRMINLTHMRIVFACRLWGANNEATEPHTFSALLLFSWGTVYFLSSICSVKPLLPRYSTPLSPYFRQFY